MQRCLSMDICSVKELTSALNGSSLHPAIPSIVPIYPIQNTKPYPLALFSRHFVLPSLHSLLTWQGSAGRCGLPQLLYNADGEGDSRVFAFDFSAS